MADSLNVADAPVGGITDLLGVDASGEFHRFAGAAGKILMFDEDGNLTVKDATEITVDLSELGEQLTTRIDAAQEEAEAASAAAQNALAAANLASAYADAKVQEAMDAMAVDYAEARNAAEAALGYATAAGTILENVQTSQSDVEAMKLVVEATKVSAQDILDEVLSSQSEVEAMKLATEAARDGAEGILASAQASQSESEAARDAALAAQAASELARTGAQTAATNANGSATAAAGSASLAETRATDAGNSATAAAASVVAAESAADDASTSASAAATSSASASSQAGEAESSAAAAAEAKTEAETARSQAETFRNEASTASDTASASAAVATTQAGLSADSATEAGNSASAAALSEAAAATKATEAGVSAEAATSAKTSAETSQAQAESFRDEAVTAKESAEGSAATATTQAGLAVSSATAAGGSATAASNSATTAATHATDAGTSAATAATAKTEAETARSQAEAFSNTALTASDEAQDSAAAATTQAGIAAGSATTAGNSATAAATSAGAASTSATGAATSATAATTAKTAAETAQAQAKSFRDETTTAYENAQSAAAVASEQAGIAVSVANRSTLLPIGFNSALSNWTTARAGDPDAQTLDKVAYLDADPVFGPSCQFSPTGVGENVLTRGVLIAPNRVFRVTIQMRVVSPASGNVNVTPIFVMLDAGYEVLGIATKNVTVNAATAEYTFSTTFGPAGSEADLINTSAAQFVRAGLRLGAAGSPVLVIAQIAFEDITGVAEAERFAAAAATSASTAATKATEAGASAAAAAGSKTSAETASAQAQGYRDEAVTSSQTAETAAATATTQAGIAASATSDVTRISSENMPSNFERDGLYWTNTLSGAPALRQTTSLSAVVTFGTDAGEGRYAQVPSPISGNTHFAPKSYVTGVIGNRYRLTVRARHVGAFAGGSQSALSLRLRHNSSSYGSLSDFGQSTATFAAPDTWQTFTLEGVFSGVGPYFLPFAYVTASAFGGATGRSIQIASVKIEDITAQTSAANSANAAATSASAAAASASGASTSATAATTARTAAETARSQAEAYSTTAATSAQTAETAASLAETQAGIAVASSNNLPTLPSNFAPGLHNWTETNSGSPAAVSTPPRGVYLPADPVFGPSCQWSPLAVVGSNLLTRGVMSTPGRRFGIKIRFRILSVSSGTTLSIGAVARSLNSSMTIQALLGTGYAAYPANGSVCEIDARFPDHANFANYPYARFGLRTDEAKSAVIVVEQIRVTDLTSEIAAESSANAAATSASSASSFSTAAASSATAANNSRIAAETARTGANTASTSAGVARDAAVVAKTSAETAAASAADSVALASKVLSRGVGGVLSDQFLAAAQWLRWSSQGTLTKIPNELFPTGQTWQFTVTASQTDGIYISASPAALWQGQTNASAYVVEIEYTLVSGSMNGAQVLFDWNTSSGEFRVTKTLSSMTSGNDVLGVQIGKVLIARAVFIRPSNFSGTFTSHDLFVTANYGTGLAAKTIKFHRIFVRVATEEELGSGQVMANVQGLLATSYFTRAETNSAIAAAKTDTESKLGETNAKVTATQSTVAALNGSVARFDLVTSAGGGRVAAGLEIVSFDGVSGVGSGSAIKLNAQNIIAQGTLSTDALIVGIGKNIAIDPMFNDGIAHWQFLRSGQTTSSGSVREPGSTWAHPAYPTLMLYQSDASTAGYAEFQHRPVQDKTGIRAIGVPVAAGKIYTASAYLSSHRCQCRVYLQFFGEDGTAISTVQSTQGDVGSGASNSPDSWTRRSASGIAPTGAVFARMIIRKFGTTSGANSYLFIWKPQIEESAFIGQEPSPWSAGGTTYIDGGRMFAQTVTTRELAAEAVEANNVKAGIINVGHTNTASFMAAGIALFGGSLQSTNFNEATGAGWRITNAGQMTMPWASIKGAWIGELQVDTAHIKDLSISSFYSVKYDGTHNLAIGGDRQILSLNVPLEIGDRVILFASYLATVGLAAGATTSSAAYGAVLFDGAAVKSGSISLTARRQDGYVQESPGNQWVTAIDVFTAIGTRNHVFALRGNGSGVSTMSDPKLIAVRIKK